MALFRRKGIAASLKPSVVMSRWHRPFGARGRHARPRPVYAPRHSRITVDPSSMKLFYRKHGSAVLAALLSLWTMAAAAQTYVEQESRVGRPYLDVGLGWFEPQK